MNEAVGNSSLFYIVIFIVGIVMLIVVSSVSYSKAYRVKNRIIQSIENEGEYVADTISTDLKTIGYQTNLKSPCDDITVKEKTYSNQNKTTYKYCVYRIDLDDGKYYYKVTTYMHFDFPIIGNFIETPVHGETKIMGQTYDY